MKFLALNFKKRKTCTCFLLAVFSTLLAPLHGFTEGKEFRKRGQDQVVETEEDIVAEVRFGKLLAAKILGKYKIFEGDPVLVKYVNLVGHGLARYSGRPELDFHFALLDSDSINAFAAPGGYVFLTLGSLKRMRSEAELAGVLAHEIAHVSQKHIARDLGIRGRDSSVFANFSALIQGVGGGGSVEAVFHEVSDRAAELLLDKGLKEEDELEADRLGTLISAQVGYNPSALRDYLGLIRDETQDEKSLVRYKKTHPSFDKRIENLRVLAVTNGLTAVEGKDVRERFIRFAGE
ncbi:MAG: M48 family metalloprotease [Nitrospinota bacterium]